MVVLLTAYYLRRYPCTCKNYSLKHPGANHNPFP